MFKKVSSTVFIACFSMKRQIFVSTQQTHSSNPWPTHRVPPHQIPGSRAKIPLNPDEPLGSRNGANPTNRKLVRVRTQRVPIPLLSRDERKSKDKEDDEDEKEDNDVATSAEAPPRLGGDVGEGNGGKNGKEGDPYVRLAG